MTRAEVGTSDLLMITFDALRYDVAQSALCGGRTPFLAKIVGGEWECRHSPGNFTYAAHAAYFAGFWPTPVSNCGHKRPFALRFAGSRSVDSATCVVDGDNIVTGLQRLGYRTLCVGGVGFFNKLNPLGSVFPALFEESVWRPEFAVSEVHSAREQVRQAMAMIEESPADQPLLLFVNLSATHPPTHIYVRGASGESTETQAAALAYVDRQLPPLFAKLSERGRGGTAYLMSDHGTLFGENELTGHRVGHPLVWTVPYAEYSWEPGA
jgi:hypothetical protein